MRLGTVFGIVLVIVVAAVLWNQGKPPVPEGKTKLGIWGIDTSAELAELPRRA